MIFDGDDLSWAKACPFDYLEIKGDYLLKLSDKGDIGSLLALDSLSFDAMTSPLPRSLGAKVVGHDADHAYALKIFEKMTGLAAELGVRKVVFGCGKARSIPEKFKLEWAREQLMEFLNKANIICSNRGQLLGVEPLHRGETNFINSCVEAQEIISETPGVSVTADCYHIFTEQLDVNDELNNCKVEHSHTSSLPRGSGVFKKEQQWSFLQRLKLVGCNSLSIEEKFSCESDMRTMLLMLQELVSADAESLCELPL